ncbi:YdcF family protein [Aquibacillus halophilus]|uniref:YdcF family protein n=1 Tax=Aquibacillus halophilus TaxID=930132 RepID=A0A6A8DAB7_9BACI|nr:YdcF family protein [Aquibacillus halophilus]MRH42504.1 YdcF family protein [Aquibacillus halophilus]
MTNTRKRKIKRLIKVLIISMFFWFFIHSVVIVIDGINDELVVADVAVVLGNKVELNGEPSNRLQARLDKVAELYKKGYFNNIIVSGGIGVEGFDEAKVMKDYLTSLGISKDRIIEDSNGYNSFMTARNSRIIMDDLEFQSAMIITQYFHITRTKLAFQKVGIDKVYSAHAEIFQFRDIYSLIREFPAFYKYLVQY